MSLEHDECKASITRCCSLLGYTKQAYFKQLKVIEKVAMEEDLILYEVKSIRESQPVIGGRKLFYIVSKRLLGVMTIGRDSFFNLLRDNKLLIKRKRTFRPITTISWHNFHKYPNLIKDMTPHKPNEIWVADITYLTSRYGTFYYLSLITDAYSRKIIGWYVSEDLSMEGPSHALEKALRGLPEGQYPIHHTDRGIQYCSKAYTKRLKDAGLRISMTQNGNPRENAIAERVNGILKDEWLNRIDLGPIQQVRDIVDKIIGIYNNERPHESLNMMTPQEAYSSDGPIKRTWKTYYKKRKEENYMNINF